VRSTASAAWFKASGDDFTAVTAAYGMNHTAEANRHAALLEIARHRGANGFSVRAELVEVETSLLLTDTVPSLQDESRKNPVGALTLGGLRDVIKRNWLHAAIGADVTLYAVPAVLRASYGSQPVSFRVFFRLRPPASPMGRMWNMRMSQPMKPMADMPVDPHAHMHMP
jgi:hypothetical protein